MLPDEDIFVLVDFAPNPPVTLRLDHSSVAVALVTSQTSPPQSTSLPMFPQPVQKSQLSQCHSPALSQHGRCTRRILVL